MRPHSSPHASQIAPRYARRLRRPWFSGLLFGLAAVAATCPARGQAESAPGTPEVPVAPEYELPPPKSADREDAAARRPDVTLHPVVRPRPAPDHSLTLEEYYQLGVPDVTQPYGVAEYKRAQQAFARFYPSAMTRLPRIGSEASGELFARLTSDENFQALKDSIGGDNRNAAAAMAEARAMMTAIVRVRQTYEVAERIVGFEFRKELIELNAVLIQSTLLMEDLARDYFNNLPAGHPDRLRSVMVFDQINNEVYKPISQIVLRSFNRVDSEPPAVRARYYERVTPALVRMLEPQTSQFKREYVQSLEELLDGEKRDNEAKAALSAMVQALRATIR